MARVLSTHAHLAVQLLGTEIAQGRRERRLSVEDLARRAGVSPVTARAVEHGSPSVSVGTVFELAVLTGVPLFTLDADELSLRLVASRDRLALLPKRVRQRAETGVSLDF